MKRFALTAAVFEGSLAVAALALGWLLGCPSLATFRFDLGDAAWGIAATLPPLGLFWICMSCRWRPLRAIARILEEALVPLFRGCSGVQLAMVAALAGLGEEMLFRGVIQAAVAGGIGGPHGVWLGLVIAAALFGLMHPITPTYAALAAAIGLYLGGLWLATGNLLAPVVAHGLYDWIALAWLVRRRGNGGEGLGTGDG